MDTTTKKLHEAAGGMRVTAVKKTHLTGWVLDWDTPEGIATACGKRVQDGLVMHFNHPLIPVTCKTCKKIDGARG